ncbi:unannotated protein [freshwater metagenome]|uniref:Unannotated protein n=1 Tax=freshwater metagenome TaxID=449393 RepID=A0A6J7HB34_9ZZZZ
MASATAEEIPALITQVGKTPADIQWDAVSAENWIEYDKPVSWTDTNGAAQTCVAKRVMWWVGPQAALVRTQLVGQLGLNAAGFWTIGGDDPAMWPLLRTYATQLAPAATAVAIIVTPRVTFNTSSPVAVSVTSQGAPVSGVDATLQFQAGGKGAWVPAATAPLAADGSANFAPTFTAAGKWRVFVPAGVARGEQASDPVPVEVASLVKANAKKRTVKAKSKIAVRVVSLPAQAGQRIVVQVQRGASWLRVAKGVTNQSGVALLPFIGPMTKGSYVYRATADSMGTFSFGVSEPFSVQVK